MADIDWNNLHMDVAKRAVLETFDSPEQLRPRYEDIYIVWFCYILGGWKALLSTTKPDDKYYEVTYNVKTEEAYTDTYQKVKNEALVFPYYIEEKNK